MGVELEVVTMRVELLSFPGVRGTGLMVNEAVGALVTEGETAVESRTPVESPRLPSVIVVFVEPPAVTPPEVGLELMVKLPTTVIAKVTECLRAPVVAATVSR